MDKTGIIILAAGNSSRMGEPKQLMTYKNKTFLQHVIDEAGAAKLNPVICVTGSDADRIAESISGSGVYIVYNPHWEEGMGSGIGTAIKHTLLSDVDSVILAVTDQPYVSSALFRTMQETKNKSGKGIVAAVYDGTMGTPVLFTKKYFAQLGALNGNEGAKKIVKENSVDTCPVVFEKGSIDIDTKSDYKKLISENQQA